ncbi:MAG: cytidine deaminase, partial [Bacteroidota bacterium]
MATPRIETALDNALNIEYELLDRDALPEDEQSLLKKAYEASQNAYAPYSRFLVGCALQMKDGSVLTGNNQENPAFPSSLCAERTALYYAGAQGLGDKIRKIAIR